MEKTQIQGRYIFKRTAVPEGAYAGAAQQKARKETLGTDPVSSATCYPANGMGCNVQRGDWWTKKGDVREVTGEELSYICQSVSFIAYLYFSILKSIGN